MHGLCIWQTNLTPLHILCIILWMPYHGSILTELGCHSLAEDGDDEHTKAQQEEPMDNRESHLTQQEQPKDNCESWSSKWNFKVHINTHTALKPHACKSCEKTSHVLVKGDTRPLVVQKTMSYVPFVISFLNRRNTYTNTFQGNWACLRKMCQNLFP